jgi:hypothetical protein
MHTYSNSKISRNTELLQEGGRRLMHMCSDSKISKNIDLLPDVRRRVLHMYSNSKSPKLCRSSLWVSLDINRYDGPRYPHNAFECFCRLEEKKT